MIIARESHYFCVVSDECDTCSLRFACFTNEEINFAEIKEKPCYRYNGIKPDGDAPEESWCI